MKKSLLIFCCFFNIGYAQSNPYFISDKHGFIQEDKIQFSYGSLLMNDTVDILKIKQSELGASTLSDTAIGDMKGEEYFIRYKIYDKAMAVLKYQDTNISYGLGDLNNQKTEFFLRHNLVSKVFALDFGYIQNKSNNIKSTDVSRINSMLAKNSDTSKYHFIKNPNPIFDNYVIAKKNTDPLEFVMLGLDPYVSLEDMKDETYYIRAVRSFVEDDIYSFDIFAQYAQTKVSTFLDTSIAHDPLLQTFVTTPAYKNLNRKEQRLTLGVGHSWFVNRWFMDIVFSMDYIKRDANLSLNNKNIKLEANLGYKIFDNTTFFIGAKVMTNQFVGEIPYLYNEYTQNSFDKKYGWAKTGLIFSF